MIFINPTNLKQLVKINDYLTDNMGYKIKIHSKCIYLFDKKIHYSDNFGFQWNQFYKTQIDDANNNLSADRLIKTTNWNLSQLNEKNILEVGSGAGRFTRCILQNCSSNLYSIDSSDAVFANFKNNKNFISKSKLYLIKSSLYNMPLMDNSFDKVLCLGVLQHTPNIEQTIKCLISKAKPGGEIIIDFYPYKGWWTKIHAKYFLRPFFSRLSNKNLLNLIKFYAPFFYYLSLIFNSIGIGVLNRFFPICDIKTLPNKVKNKLEWVILDTFDMFSPKYDQPQKPKKIEKIFKENNTAITFSDYIEINSNKSAVIRVIKKK